MMTKPIDDVNKLYGRNSPLFLSFLRFCFMLHERILSLSLCFLFDVTQMNNRDGKNYNKSSMIRDVRMAKIFYLTLLYTGFPCLEKMIGDESILLVPSCLALSHRESVYYVFI